MKTAFTIDQFLNVFRNYNNAVFPMQVIFYLAGIIAFYLVIKPASKSDKFISGLLAFLWLWMGVVYHLIFFAAINKAAYVFGIVFTIQGLLFLVLGVVQSKLSFRLRADKYGIMGVLLTFYGLVIYPVFGFSLGHIYPSAPTFGLPCPTTIFTFGILLFSDKKCPFAILIIPFFWSIIGFTAAFKFGIIEDAGLLVSGVVGLTMLLVKNRSYKHVNTKLIVGSQLSH